MPRCRLGVADHAWYQGTLSEWCEVCFLVRPLKTKRKKAMQAVAAGKGPTTTPRHTGVRSDPSKNRRAEVIARDGMVCAYCDRVVVETVDEARPDRLTIDHRVPRCQGGTNHLSNLVVACFECNNAKGEKLPHQFFVGPKGGLTKREWAAATNAAQNRHQRTHTRRDGQPKRSWADVDEAWEIAAFLAKRDDRTMEAFRCDECNQWHVRIVPGLRRVLAKQSRRYWDDALWMELGPRAFGQLKAENTTGRGHVIRALWKGTERRAKRERARLAEVAA